MLKKLKFLIDSETLTPSNRLEAYLERKGLLMLAFVAVMTALGLASEICIMYAWKQPYLDAQGDPERLVFNAALFNARYVLPFVWVMWLVSFVHLRKTGFHTIRTVVVALTVSLVPFLLFGY